MEFSVRFFKRLLLTVLVLLIVVPLFFAIWFGVSRGRVKKENERLREELAQAARELSRFEQMQGVALLIGQELTYQASYPQLYCDIPTDKTWVKASDTVYLTFDDGPSANTTAILDVLDMADVKATFFVTGQSDTAEHRGLIKEISDRGHTVGIHTYSHSYVDIYQSVEAYLADFDAAYQMIYEATGIKPELFRFPGGSVNSYNQAIYQPLTAEMIRRGFVHYDWNVSGEDTVRGATAESVTKAVLDGMSGQKRGIVLLHDSAAKDYTVEALPRIIGGLRGMGYSFEPLTPVVRPITFSF